VLYLDYGVNEKNSIREGKDPERWRDDVLTGKIGVKNVVEEYVKMIYMTYYGMIIGSPRFVA
jgi:hypothetical protein